MQNALGLYLLKLTFRNFKSFGNDITTIAFPDYQGLTCLRGENQDAQAEDSRNGCGKSAILNALAFVLTGETIKKATPLTRLVNRTNKRGAVFTLDFLMRGELCRIERGISPNFTRFYRRPIGETGDITQYDKTHREKASTDAMIESFLNMDIDVFRLIVVSMAKQPSFITMKPEAQKSLIETLFNQTRLSLKAEALKKNRELMEVELGKEIAALNERVRAYERTMGHRNSILESQTKWNDTQSKKIADQKAALANLQEIDVDLEQAAWAAIDNLNESAHKCRIDMATQTQAATSASQAIMTAKAKQTEIDKWLKEADQQDPTTYIKQWDEHIAAKAQIELLTQQSAVFSKEDARLKTAIRAIQKEIDSFNDSCPTCGQLWPDHERMKSVIDAKHAEIATLSAELAPIQSEIMRLDIGIGEHRLYKAPVSTLFKNRDDALRFSEAKENKIAMKKDLSASIAEQQGKLEEAEMLKQEISETLKGSDLSIAELKAEIVTKSKSEASTLPKMIEIAVASLSALEAEVNPFDVMSVQSSDVESEKPDRAAVEALEQSIKEHRTLESLCTRKDSPLRADILKEWVPKLNAAIHKYLVQLEYPYTIQFNSNLTVDVIDKGEETGHSDLSGGEEERVDLALSWAFRDIFEQLHYPINFYAVDERLDSGLCPAGVVKGATILRDFALRNNKTVMLITHRNDANELIDQELRVVKKNGFSELIG